MSSTWLQCYLPIEQTVTKSVGLTCSKNPAMMSDNYVAFSTWPKRSLKIKYALIRVVNRTSATCATENNTRGQTVLKTRAVPTLSFSSVQRIRFGPINVDWLTVASRIRVRVLLLSWRRWKFFADILVHSKNLCLDGLQNFLLFLEICTTTGWIGKLKQFLRKIRLPYFWTTFWWVQKFPPIGPTILLLLVKATNNGREFAENCCISLYLTLLGWHRHSSLNGQRHLPSLNKLCSEDLMQDATQSLVWWLNHHLLIWQTSGKSYKAHYDRKLRR